MKAVGDYVDDYPFLKEVLAGRTIVDSMAVMKIHEDALRCTPNDIHYVSPCHEYLKWERISFVLEDGSVIKDAVRTYSEYAHHRRTGIDVRDGETVLDALLRLRDIDDVRYIVVEACEISPTRDEYGITIYKCPGKILSTMSKQG